jgi:hypothetical protein
MSASPDLWLALGMGLLGSFGHCAAMCGPIVVVLGTPAGRARGGAGFHLRYHAGRLATYTLAGAAAGLAGSIVQLAGRLAGVQNAVLVLAGVLMVLAGLGAAGVAPAVKALEGRLAGRLFARVKRAFGAQRDKPLLLGLVLGLLPCGLSWSAFLGAAATGGPVAGGAFALVFGLGTAPSLLLLGGAAQVLSVRLRGRLARAGGLAAAAVGLVFVLRGLHVLAW